MTIRVETDTLYVEFCCGYAGVIIGIRWYLSLGFTYIQQQPISFFKYIYNRHLDFYPLLNRTNDYILLHSQLELRNKNHVRRLFYRNFLQNERSSQQSVPMLEAMATLQPACMHLLGKNKAKQKDVVANLLLFLIQQHK